MMLRRLTALLAMLALLGVLAMLIFEVHRHHERGFQRPDATLVVNFALPPALAC